MFKLVSHSKKADVSLGYMFCIWNLHEVNIGSDLQYAYDSTFSLSRVLLVS